MSFNDDLTRFVQKLEQNAQGIFTDSVAKVQESVQVGSAITGAPGQPVGQYGPGYHPGEVGGFLRSSYNTSYESKSVALVATKAVYAPQEEDGVSYAHGGIPIVHRTSVGGFHSVKMTRAGWQNIVNASVQQVVK